MPKKSVNNKPRSTLLSLMILSMLQFAGSLALSAPMPGLVCRKDTQHRILYLETTRTSKVVCRLIKFNENLIINHYDSLDEAQACLKEHQRSFGEKEWDCQPMTYERLSSN